MHKYKNSLGASLEDVWTLVGVMAAPAVRDSLQARKIADFCRSLCNEKVSFEFVKSKVYGPYHSGINLPEQQLRFSGR